MKKHKSVFLNQQGKMPYLTQLTKKKEADDDSHEGPFK